jgi:hypothetical protein
MRGLGFYISDFSGDYGGFTPRQDSPVRAPQPATPPSLLPPARIGAQMPRRDTGGNVEHRRRTATPKEVADALRDLDGAPQRIRATDWPATTRGLDLPGLYSWWTDAAGADALSAGIGVAVAPGRIYGGLTGADEVAVWQEGQCDARRQDRAKRE